MTGLQGSGFTRTDRMARPPGSRKHAAWVLPVRKSCCLAVLAAVALFVVTVWLWPRLSKGTCPRFWDGSACWWRPSCRSSRCSASPPTIRSGFYASWADLFGRSTNRASSPTTRPGGGNQEVAGGHRVGQTSRVVRARRSAAGSRRWCSRAKSVPDRHPGVRVPAAGVLPAHTRSGVPRRPGAHRIPRHRRGPLRSCITR